MIVYIKTTQAPYIQKDINFLKEKYEVFVYFYSQNSKLLSFLYNLIKLGFFLLKNRKKISIVTSTFIDYYSVLVVIFCKLYGRKSVFTLGGYECVSLPDIGYGAFADPIKKIAVKFVLRNADVLLPVDQSLIYSKSFYYKESGIENGFMTKIKKTKAQILTIPNAYEYQERGIKKIKNTVMCIANCHSPASFYVKGLDTLIKAGSMLRDYQITIVGVSSSLLPWIKTRYKLSNNINLKENIAQESVFELLAGSSIYIQPSLSEGMPNALCEAMLHECHPIGSNVAGISEIIGDTGIVVQSNKTELIAEAVLSVNQTESNKRAQLRILEKYPLEIRKQAFYKLFDSLLSK